MLHENIKNKLGQTLGFSVSSYDVINDNDQTLCLTVLLSNQLEVFVKIYKDTKMKSAEYCGLMEVKDNSSFKVPTIIYDDDETLILEKINISSPTKRNWIDLANKLNDMHLQTKSSFGYFHNNWIGATKQKNLPVVECNKVNSWAEYFVDYRLKYQYNLAENNQLIDNSFQDLFDLFIPKAYEVLSEIKPESSLLHGDLWSGNILFSGNEIYLIDPACYYGHFETDLAMTSLFGGFSKYFYDEYFRIRPRKKNWEHRQNIYNLYHLINHMNIFGKSYINSAKNIMHCFE